MPASRAADPERALPNPRTEILPGIGQVPIEEALVASARPPRLRLGWCGPGPVLVLLGEVVAMSVAPVPKARLYPAIEEQALPA